MVDAAGVTRYAYNSVGLLTLEDGPWDNDAVTFSYTNRLRSENRKWQRRRNSWVANRG